MIRMSCWIRPGWRKKGIYWRSRTEPVRLMILKSFTQNIGFYPGEIYRAVRECREDSVEYQALCEGVEALIGSMRK